MTITVDRFEGDVAVFQYDGRAFTLPRGLLPGDTREGDVLRLDIEIDRPATSDRRMKIKSLEGKLFRK